MTNSGTSLTNLTGVWHGRYSYPYAQDPVSFVATLLDAAGFISGRMHELCGYGPSARNTIFAAIDGTRLNAIVTFTKTYENVPLYETPAHYSGTLNSDASEISGTWNVPGHWSGTFLMIRASNLKATRTIPTFETA